MATGWRPGTTHRLRPRKTVFGGAIKARPSCATFRARHARDEGRVRGTIDKEKGLLKSLSSLDTVRNRIALGTPLPFNVRNADRTLLLARGQRLQSQEQLEALMLRGALVDLAELLSSDSLMLDDALTQRLKDAIKTVLSARHVPNDIFQLDAVPRTLSGKKMELPVKKLLQGAAPNTVFKLDAMANADCVAWFADFAARRGA
jgi:hypothetical protein